MEAAGLRLNGSNSLIRTRKTVRGETYGVLLLEAQRFRESGQRNSQPELRKTTVITSSSGKTNGISQVSLVTDTFSTGVKTEVVRSQVILGAEDPIIECSWIIPEV